MPDAASLSVVSSAAVALGGLWLTYRSARDQRKHEAQQAYEGRAWEKKSEALFSTIAIARSIVDTLRSPNQPVRDTFALHFVGTRDRLDELVPVVEAYASAACRAAMNELRSLLREGQPDYLVEDRVIKARQEKEDAIDLHDFKGAAAARDRERTAMHLALEGLGIDLDEVVTLSERLIDAARASVRGQE